jgi:hypothetical protein
MVKNSLCKITTQTDRGSGWNCSRSSYLLKIGRRNVKKFNEIKYGILGKFPTSILSNVAKTTVTDNLSSTVVATIGLGARVTHF